MDIVFLIGRILLGGFFLMSGINHFTHLQMMTGYAAAKKVPAPAASIIISGIMLVLGGLSLILGAWPRIGALLIAIFLIAVTPAIHNYWTVSDPQQRMAEQVNFMKNIALLGASLMLLAGTCGWPLSLGR